MPLNGYYVTRENSEDRLDAADNLPEAVRLARQWASEGETGEPVCIEHEGKNIRQFVRMPNGRIDELDLS